MQLPVASADPIGFGFSQSSERRVDSDPEPIADFRVHPVGAEPDSALLVEFAPSPNKAVPTVASRVVVPSVQIRPDLATIGLFQPTPVPLRPTLHSAGIFSSGRGCFRPPRFTANCLQSVRVRSQTELSTAGFVPSPLAFSSSNFESPWSLPSSTGSQNANGVLQELGKNSQTMKSLNHFISSAEYLNFSKHRNKFKWAIIFPSYSCQRSYGSTPNGFPPGSLFGENHSILQSSAFQHRFKKWQHLRKHKLTASTFSLAIGFRPGGRLRLWKEKIGKVEPFSSTLATSWSNMKEEEALERYELITRNEVAFPKFQVYGKENHEDSWLAASPDGAIKSNIYDLPSYGVLEIKCPFYGEDTSTVPPWKRVPLRYIPQAQGLMEILDRDWMDMYVWTVNGSSLFRIQRNADYWNLLKKALSDFWWNHVQPAKEICNQPETKDQASKLIDLQPAPKHELFQEIICKSKRVSDDSRLLIREIHGVLQN